jgi:DNA-binding beta-propeller fold protein YncE
LTENPPRVLADVLAGLQPSGLSISPDGTFAVVANRAGGSVTRLRIRGKEVTPAETLTFTHGTNEVSDVAISPDGRFAVASVREANHLRVFRCDGDALRLTERKVSASGRPYRVIFSPDGQLVLTAGQGAGNPGGNDVDAMTVIRRRGDEFQTSDYVALGSGPETIEVSPDGRLVAALLMNGSNLAAGTNGYHDHGQLVILRRRGETFVRTQTIPVGRIPEGVAFTPDGRHLVVQGHPDRELRIYPVSGGRVSERYERIPVPGFPAAIRAGPIQARR